MVHLVVVVWLIMVEAAAVDTVVEVVDKVLLAVATLGMVVAVVDPTIMEPIK
jgi:hypothetical protein